MVSTIQNWARQTLKIYTTDQPSFDLCVCGGGGGGWGVQPELPAYRILWSIVLSTCMLLDRMFVWLPSSVSHLSSWQNRRMSSRYRDLKYNGCNYIYVVCTWTSFSNWSTKDFSSSSMYTVIYGSKQEDTIPWKLNCKNNGPKYRYEYTEWVITETCGNTSKYAQHNSWYNTNPSTRNRQIFLLIFVLPVRRC
jgi:hypothetical protein